MQGRPLPSKAIVRALGMVGAILALTPPSSVAFAGPSSAGSVSVPSSPPPAQSAQGGISVRVVDEAGAPLAGVDLVGTSPVNPGPVASFCCIPKTFATTVTDREGRAVVGPVPFTFRPLTIRATYRDWPTRTWQSSSAGLRVPPELVLVLGPLRDIRGKVRVAPICPASALNVHADSPQQKVAVEADGSFALSRVAPWTHLTLIGCGRRQDADLATFRGRPIELELPSDVDREPGNTVRASPTKPD